jgi:hypothetical protein
VSVLKRGVKMLEEGTGQAELCLECGHVSGEFAQYDVTWLDDGGKLEEPEFCETLGEELVYVVRWGGKGEGVGSKCPDVPE